MEKDRALARTKTFSVFLSLSRSQHPLCENVTDANKMAVVVANVTASCNVDAEIKGRGSDSEAGRRNMPRAFTLEVSECPCPSVFCVPEVPFKSEPRSSLITAP